MQNLRCWRRAQRGWPASFPLVQFPNAPLLAALGAWLVAAFTDRSVHAYALATFYAALAVCAWLGVTAVLNWVCRSLGAAALAYIVVKVGAALEAGTSHTPATARLAERVGHRFDQSRASRFRSCCLLHPPRFAVHIPRRGTKMATGT